MRPTYSVAIRTLGTAGDKFEKEIASILRQTYSPEGIYAYIPHGYDIPEFPNSEKITWVRSEKGMITQRALPFDEISSEFILFLDDDVELAPDSVERLFDGLAQFDGDAIAANMFPNHQKTLLQRILISICGTGFFKSDKWAFKVRKSAHYSYNCPPPQAVMLSQTGAGACSLVRKSAYRSMHFEDERWMENISGYCFGEDQLFFNKMYQMGYTVLVHYDSGAKNLDAGAGGGRDLKKVIGERSFFRYIIWHRTQYKTAKSLPAKMHSLLCYSFMQIPLLVGDLMFSLKDRTLYRIPYRFRGIAAGIRYSRTDSYKAIPPFDAYKRK